MNKTQTNKTAMRKTDFTPQHHLLKPGLSALYLLLSITAGRHHDCRRQRSGWTGLWFDGQKYFAATPPLPANPGSRRFLKRRGGGLTFYFSGKNPGYLPPLHLTGTPSAWPYGKSCAVSPYGQTNTDIGEIARKRRIGKTERPPCRRKVGNAVGHRRSASSNTPPGQ